MVKVGGMEKFNITQIVIPTRIVKMVTIPHRLKETFTDQNVTKDYTSARLNSKFAFTYGRVEARAQLPTEWALGLPSGC